MAGIFGFLQFRQTFGGTDACKKLIHCAQQGFSHPAAYLLEQDESAAIGFCFPPVYDQTNWPLQTTDGRYWFQLAGEIFLPSGESLSRKNFEEHFLTPLQRQGTDVLKKVDGSFVFAVYDRVKKEFTLYNDAFGNFALHYVHFANGFIFSSQMTGIRKVLGKLDLDLDGIGEFLGIAQTLNGRTMFKNVYRLPAASYLVASQDRFHIGCYYRPQYRSVASSTANLETIKDSFITAVRNRTARNRTAAALTSGYDTRLTWAIVNSLGRVNHVNAFTHGLPDCRDIQIAKRIASQLRMNHVVLSFDDEFVRKLPSYWQRTIELTEGGLGIDSAATIASWEFETNDHRMLLDSHGGALYRRQFMKVKERQFRPNRSISDEMFRFLKSPLMSSPILKRDVVRLSLDRSISGLEQYFSAIQDSGRLGDQIDLFYIHQISGQKYSLGGTAQLNYVGLHHPLLNLRAFDAVQKLPISSRCRNTVHKYVIQQVFPRLTDFPLENMGLWVPYRGFEYLRYVPMAYEFMLQKFARWTPKGMINKLSLRRPVSDSALFLRIHMDVLREILLSRNSIFDEYVERVMLERRLQEFSNGQDSFVNEIVQVASFKLFSEAIVSGSL